METTTAQRVSNHKYELFPARVFRAVKSASEGAALRIVPLTVEQYHRMIAIGLLPEGEPIELLDGLLVWKDRAVRGKDPMTVGEYHARVINRLADLHAKLKPLGWRVRIQLPLTIPPDNEPEPDGAIVRETVQEYGGGHPGPGEVFCVIEAADSSLEHDRGTKQRIYANAGIPQYLIVNLPDRQIEVHEQPLAGHGRYGSVVIVKAGQTVALLLGEGKRLEVATAELLP